jgi:Fic family protein
MLEYTGDQGGVFKTVDNSIEEVLADGSRIVRFVPTPAWQTPDAIDRLFARTTRALTQNELHSALVIGALVFDYVCIHPFLDGNGRTSRLLTLLGIYTAGYGVGRYVSLEQIVAESKESYYEALRAAGVGWQSGTHNPLPWIEYFIGMLLVAYSRFEERVETLGTHRGAKTDAISTFVRARAIPTFTVADIRIAVPTASDAHIRKVLHALRDAGEIESTGRGRSAGWRRIDGGRRVSN